MSAESTVRFLSNAGEIDWQRGRRSELRDPGGRRRLHAARGGSGVEARPRGSSTEAARDP